MGERLAGQESAVSPLSPNLCLPLRVDNARGREVGGLTGLPADDPPPLPDFGILGGVEDWGGRGLAGHGLSLRGAGWRLNRLTP